MRAWVQNALPIRRILVATGRRDPQCGVKGCVLGLIVNEEPRIPRAFDQPSTRPLNESIFITTVATRIRQPKESMTQLETYSRHRSC